MGNFSVSPTSGQDYSYMYGRLPDKMQAASYYQSAISVGQDIEAMNCLGLMYENGLGLDRVVVDYSP